jgi:hypothetical protein
MNGPETGKLAMSDTLVTEEDLRRMRGDEAPAQVAPAATKHRRPSLRVGLESEDGSTYLAVTDHESGHRMTLRLSPESMASLGSQMLTTSAGDGLGLQCWLEGSLEVVK